MKISCIIPTRDRRDMVSDAVASVIAQGIPDLEIIVVDDGSGDGTAAALRRAFPGLTVIEERGLGPGLARNKGVETSQGDILMFLDSDDTWLPGHAETLFGVINRGFSVAYGTTKNNNYTDGGGFLIPDKGVGREGDCFQALTNWCFLVPSSVAVKRGAFESVGGFSNSEFGEDWDFFLRLAEAYDFGFAGPAPITNRRLHAGSLCGRNGRKIIIHSLRKIAEVVSTSRKMNLESMNRLQAMAEWVSQNGMNYITVQDWYCAMKKEGWFEEND